jgi:hypothetical protein
LNNILADLGVPIAPASTGRYAPVGTDPNVARHLQDKGAQMKLKNLALLLAISGVVAYPYLRRQRSRVAAGGPPPSWQPDTQDDQAAADLAYRSPSHRFDDSPNAAERLHDENVLRSPVYAASGSEELSSSSSQRGEEPTAAGLPDLTRGA